MLRSTLAVVTTVLLAGALAGCTGGSEPESQPTSGPVSALDLSGVVVARDAFCDRLEEKAVADLLGGSPSRTTDWAPGQRVALEPGVRDVANEFGCSFQGDGGTARAWVLAPQVRAADARRLVADRRRERGCEPTGELAFGEPGVVLACRARGDERVALAGLFGDAWLSCELSGSGVTAPDRVEDAQRWCAGVAEAAGSS